jgi:hypothetical protein
MIKHSIGFRRDRREAAFVFSNTHSENVRYWHLADIRIWSELVAYWVHSGHPLSIRG